MAKVLGYESAWNLAAMKNKEEDSFSQVGGSFSKTNFGSKMLKKTNDSAPKEAKYWGDWILDSVIGYLEEFAQAFVDKNDREPSDNDWERISDDASDATFEDLVSCWSGHINEDWCPDGEKYSYLENEKSWDEIDRYI